MSAKLMTSAKPSTAGLVSAVASSKSATRMAGIIPDSVINTKRLTKLLVNPNAKLSGIDRKIVLSTINQLNSGKSAAKVVRVIGRALGRVITRAEARKVLETKLNAQTAQQALKSNENIQKAAIDAGLWNAGINFDTTNAGQTAPGSSGNNQNNSIGGSILGG